MKTKQAVLRDFSEQAFCTNLRTAIENVTNQAPHLRSMRARIASQAQNNPAAYLNTYANDLGVLLRGAAHLKADNRHDQAARFWQRAVLIDSSCIIAMSELSAYYADKGQMKKAAALIKRVLELCPADKQALSSSQKIAPSTGNFQAASSRMTASRALVR
jgi:tetratricopeptide (TPR) repeat protein